MKPESAAQRLAAASIVVAVAVLAIKFVAFRLTGSAALYSDALESFVNVVTAGSAWFAVRVARRPPDQRHPFGHHKAEDVAAGFVGAIILFAAYQIVRVAVAGLLDPRPLERTLEGLAVASVAGVANLAWGVVLVRSGKRFASPALRADGVHLLTDVLSSVGVVVGLFLAHLFDLPLLDPILALVVAVNVLIAGWGLIRGSISSLLDETPDEVSRERILGAIESAGAGALQVHDLRARRSGSQTFVEFHLVVDGSLSVREAHRICDRIEDAVQAAEEGTEVLIHVEPDHEAESDAAIHF